MTPSVPDLIFMDIGLPDGSGLEFTKRIKTARPQVSVAMLTSHGGPEYREAANRYGASHFFTKGVVARDEIQNLVKSSASVQREDKSQRFFDVVSTTYLSIRTQIVIFQHKKPG